jgi:hypothetical protein
VDTFPVEINDDPSILALLDIRESQSCDLGPAKTTSDEHGHDRTVPLAFHGIGIR